MKTSLFRGNRYTDEQIADLPEDSLAFLKDIICSYAWWFLWRRKSANTDPDDQQFKQAKETHEEYARLLRTGEIVLDVPAVKDAGVASSEAITAYDVQRRNNWSQQPRGRLYPIRRFPY